MVNLLNGKQMVVHHRIELLSIETLNDRNISAWIGLLYRNLLYRILFHRIVH